MFVTPVNKILKLRLLMICTWALSVPAAGQWADWDYEFDQEKKSWSEIKAKIPPYPKSENLIEFEADPSSPHRFYIDSESISIGEDGVVRYTFIIKSAGGASNVSFEGIRCELKQQKFYAVGQPGGGWTRTRNPQWRQPGRFHGVLSDVAFCNGKIPVSSPGEAVRLLQSGKPRLRD